MIAQNDRDLILVTSASKSGYKEEFLTKMKELNLENRVHILENISNDEVFFFCRNAKRMFILRYEGFGIPPVFLVFESLFYLNYLY